MAAVRCVRCSGFAWGFERAHFGACIWSDLVLGTYYPLPSTPTPTPWPRRRCCPVPRNKSPNTNRQQPQQKHERKREKQMPSQMQIRDTDTSSRYVPMIRPQFPCVLCPVSEAMSAARAEKGRETEKPALPLPCLRLPLPLNTSIFLFLAAISQFTNNIDAIDSYKICSFASLHRAKQPRRVCATNH